MDEEILKKARLKKLKTDKNMEAAEKAFIGLMAETSHAKNGIKRYAYAFATIILIAAGIAGAVYLSVENNNSPGKVNNLGGVWCTFDDSGSGGESVVWPPASTKNENNFVKSEPGFGGKGYAVRLTGRAGTKLGWDYIGMLTFLSSRSSCPECSGVNIRGYKNVRFRIKGKIKKGRLLFIIPYESSETDRKLNTCLSLTNYADYEADITGYVTPEWKTVSLDLRKDFSQPEWAEKDTIADIEKVLADARLVKWQYKGGKGEKIDIWIDDLEFY